MTATQLKRSALAHFNYATREADREFHWIARRIEQLQAEVAAEQLVNDARDAMLGFHWETAASKMREAAKIRPAGFPGDRQDEGLIKYCQDIELQVASAHDLATGGRWDEALESIRDITPESLVPRTNGRQDDESRRWRNELLTSWSRHLNLDQVRGIWRRASQAYNHLHTLAGGAAVDAAGAGGCARCPPRLARRRGRHRIGSPRHAAQNAVGPARLVGGSAQTRCAVFLRARSRLARGAEIAVQTVRRATTSPAYHRLAVMAMARGLDGQKPGGDRGPRHRLGASACKRGRKCWPRTNTGNACPNRRTEVRSNCDASTACSPICGSTLPSASAAATTVSSGCGRPEREDMCRPKDTASLC